MGYYYVIDYPKVHRGNDPCVWKKGFLPSLVYDSLLPHLAHRRWKGSFCCDIGKGRTRSRTIQFNTPYVIT